MSLENMSLFFQNQFEEIENHQEVNRQEEQLAYQAYIYQQEVETQRGFHLVQEFEQSQSNSLEEQLSQMPQSTATFSNPSFEEAEEEQLIGQDEFFLWEKLKNENPLHLAIRCYQLQQQRIEQQEDTCSKESLTIPTN